MLIYSNIFKHFPADLGSVGLSAGIPPWELWMETGVPTATRTPGICVPLLSRDLLHCRPSRCHSFPP